MQAITDTPPVLQDLPDPNTLPRTPGWIGPDTLCPPTANCPECDAERTRRHEAFTTEPGEVNEGEGMTIGIMDAGRIATLERQVAELTQTAATNAQERDQARQELAVQAEQGLEWIEKLLETAHEAADRHNLCEVYDEVCRNMGLPGRKITYQVSVQAMVDLTISVEARYGEIEGESDLENHLSDELVRTAVLEQLRYEPRGLEWEIQEWSDDE